MKLHHAAIQVRDLECARAFYVDVLGLSELRRQREIRHHHAPLGEDVHHRRSRACDRIGIARQGCRRRGGLRFRRRRRRRFRDRKSTRLNSSHRT